MSGEAKVVVVDDHSTFSQLLARALDHERDVECVGTAPDAKTAAQLVDALLPDVVVMDVQLGDDDGIELTAALIERHPGLRVVVLTARTDPELVQRAAAAGACSLLPKNGQLEEVLTAIRTARSGGLAVHPTLLKSLLSVPSQRVPTAQITGREREVLGLLADGRSVRQIAKQLVISEHTARGHVKKLLAKLDAHSQLEAVAQATRLGLL
jgi:DNA-binding NarL/FixJ family response regulator